jgi:hypothetical protein
VSTRAMRSVVAGMCCSFLEEAALFLRLEAH